MIIENPELFKAWLTAVLEPLCDADPAALAKYVYALVKKDKTLEELRVDMVEQLDVFLQQETKRFVEMLFKTLETQEYILPPPKSDPDGGGTPPGINPPAPVVSSSTEKLIDSTIPLVPIIANPSVPLQINGSAPAVVSKRETRKSDSDKDKVKEKRSRSRSGRMRSRTRSRSRSWERDRRRSRSREHLRRDRERDRSRPWRNESPPISTRRHDRRRSRSRSSSPIRSRIRDGPDNRDHRARFRNRSPTPLRSRSRSRSIERKKIDRFERMEIDRTDRIEGSPGGGTPTQDSNHGDVDMRLSTTSQSIQSVVAVASSISNNQTSSFPQQAKRRCRDFDEKGYCMRGDLCPYDHGTDPVVLEDVALSRVLSFGPHSAQAPGTVPVATVPEPPQGPNGNPPPPHLPLASLPPPHLRNHHSNMEYNPDAPSMEPRMAWGRHPQPAPGIYGRGQRELISVPVIQHTNSSEITHTQNNPLKRKQTFDFNRLGPKQRAVHNPANCSLELKKVPRSLNNITQLNNHFSKFGKIVNIQVTFGGDPEAALVTFQLPAEAKAAYRSTEAVLNNRFIKVFWHNNVNTNAAGGAIENVPPGCRPSVKERLGAAVTLPAKAEDNEYVPTRRSTEEQVTQTTVPTSPKAAVVPTREDKVLAIKKSQEILAAKETLKKKQEEKRKEAIKLTADLRKRKQELLDKHLIELRVLIDKAEKNPEQKDSIMQTIKAMQQSIDNLRKDLAANGQIGGNKSQVKSREQTQKEILDAELDLMTAQQEGQDAGELQKRLNELRAQAAALGLNTNSAAGRGTRTNRAARSTLALSYRGRGRASFTHVSVDHRPTGLLVSGYETEEKAEVLAHFQQFGEIVNQIVDDATPSIVINFKSRKEAEVALAKGRTFQDRLLSITWVSSHHLHRGGAGSNSSASVQLSSRSEQTAAATDEDIDLETFQQWLLFGFSQIRIEFDDLCYSVCNNKGTKKTILRDVTGYFEPGKITVIIGPSGAGKTTLLKIVSGERLLNVKGTIALNGVVQNKGTFRKQVCNVPQKFSLLPFLTTRETLYIAARLKLNVKQNKQKFDVINEIVNNLGLSDCLDTLAHKLSGGERKRLSIGVEIITNPSILLLDEPTSGLDSAASNQLINVLHTMAKANCTIVCAIHQPSSRMISQFDNIMVLDRGRSMYCGPKSKILYTFENAGFTCPPFYNIAEFVLEAITKQRGGDLEDLYKFSRHEYENSRSHRKRDGTNLFTSKHNSDDDDISTFTSNANLWQQQITLFIRALICIKRDIFMTILRYSAHVVVAVLLGIVFYDFGNDAEKVNSNIACLFFFLLFLFFANAMPAVQMFPTEAAVFLQEHLNNWYSLKSYYSVKILTDLLLQILCSSSFILIAYYMTGQPMEFNRALQAWSICVLVTILGQTVGIFIGAAFNTEIGIFLIPASSIPLLLFAGYFVKINEILMYLRPLGFVSFFRYAFEGLMQAVYLDRPKLLCHDAYCYLRSPDAILSMMDLPTVSFHVILIILGFWILCLHVIIYAVLCWKIYYAKK